MEPALIGAGIGAGARLFPNVAKGTGSVLKAIGKKFTYKLSGSRYDKKMVELYGIMRVFGQTEPRPLDDIFTDVHILPKPTLMRRFSLDSLHEQFLETPRNLSLRYDERVAADELIETTDKLFILGKPGAGKTTFCKHLAVREAKGIGRIDKVPIFVTLKQYADTGKTLIEFINEQFDVCDFPDAAPFVEALLRGGKALVLFDGLDEVTKDANGRNRVATEINEFSRKYSDCHIVVTCRVAANDYVFEQFSYVEMAEFAPEQVETFVRQWFVRDEESVEKADKMLAELAQHDGISDLTRNPLLLTLLCLNYDETMAFPTRRVEIYQDALDALMKKWDSSRGIQRGSAYGSLSLGRKQEMLAEIAYNTYREGRYFFERREIEPLLADYVAGVPEVPDKIDIDGEVILQEIVAQHGLLAYRATDILSFSHKTFHEYFAARQIVDTREDDTLKELLKRSVDDSWNEVFLMTSSMLGRSIASNFFEMFVQVVHEALQQHPNAVEWLAKIATAAKNSMSNYQSVAIRIFFARASVNDLWSATQIDRTLALHLTFAYDFLLNPPSQPNQALVLHGNLALDFDLANISLLASRRVSGNVPPFAQNHVAQLHIACIRARALGLSVLALKLETLSVPSINDTQQEWELFLEMLQVITNTYRPLDKFKRLQTEAHTLAQEIQHCTLTDYDVTALIMAIIRSKRLYDCLQVAYLPPEERAAFEAQLLLPPQ